MNILYAGNSKVVSQASVSILSLLENNSNEKIHIYFIEDAIKNSDKKKLQDICGKYSAVMDFIRADTIIPENFKTYGSRFSRISFARLFVQKLPVDKIIWLDCDTLVCGSLRNLWNEDISDNLYGAVKDTVKPRFRYQLGLSLSDNYYNSGVLLINVRAQRQINYIEKVLEYVDKYNNENGCMVPHNDQGIINYLAKCKIYTLPIKYNVMAPVYFYKSRYISDLYHISDYYSINEIDEARTNPCVIHFVEGWYGRPWQNKCTHPMKESYRAYMKKNNIPMEGNVNLSQNIKMEKVLYNYLPYFLYKIIKGKRDER